MAERNVGKICHTCGGTGNVELIVTCDQCRNISTHVYCINIVPQEIPEQWYCEDCIAHEQASNDPKGNSPLDKPRLERAQLEFVPLTKARAPPQTGKVKFISEREITLLNDRKYFAKRSLAQERVPKTRCMKDILGLPRHNKKKEVVTRDIDKEASQKNREPKPEKEKLINLPVSEVVWKGVINYFELVSHTHNVQVHPAEKASTKVKEILKEMPRKLSLEVKPKSEFWPEAFKIQPPSHEDIGLYFFSSESDRKKEKFHRMVERLYKYNQVLVGRIGILGLYIFPSQILPKYNQYIRERCPIKLQSPSVPPPVERENHDPASGCSQVKSNELDVDMEIDMIGGVELSTTLRAKFTSQPDPIVPPGFHSSHLKSNNPGNYSCLESDMAMLTTSPVSQLSCSGPHSMVEEWLSS